ncbi:MAG: diguanylate cyclase [Lachnospiraceae bacterium]|nr:diguanylate cyclase [Lachnospiraceae bacterium]
MNPFGQILEVLRSDRSGEDRANGVMILTRFLVSIVFMMFMVFAIFCQVRSLFPYNVYYFVASVALIGVLMVSYKFKHGYVITGAFMVIVFFMSYLIGPAFGWKASYHEYLLLGIMTCWYDSSKSVKQKTMISGIFSMLIAALAMFCKTETMIIEETSYEYRIFTIVNILVFCLCLSIAAYFLCSQTVNDERKLLLYNQKLKHIAGIDPLTNLMNRRAVGEKFEEISHIQDAVITVAIGDIDFFKKVNDTRGHDCGDYVLKTLAYEFEKFMSDKGYVARWGGEEFLFVFSDSNGDDAYAMLEMLREKVQGYKFEFFGHEFNITMTFGVEEYSNRFGTEEAIKKADEKLYLGKESGRNKVVY